MARPKARSPQHPEHGANETPLDNLVSIDAARSARGPARGGVRADRPKSTQQGEAKARRLVVLPTVRAEEYPARGSHTMGKTQARKPALCAGGEACVSYDDLGSPAKLSRHNTARIGGKRYCYGCRSAIADAGTRSTAHRRLSESSAARAHMAAKAGGGEAT